MKEFKIKGFMRKDHKINKYLVWKNSFGRLFLELINTSVTKSKVDKDDKKIEIIIREIK